MKANQLQGAPANAAHYIIKSVYRGTYFIAIHSFTPFYGDKEKAKQFDSSNAATAYARAELFDNDIAFEVERVCPTCGGGHPVGCCAQDGHGG